MDLFDLRTTAARGTIMPDVRGLSSVRGGGNSFTPATLFASGEQGAWYDPSDLSTLYQDAAGTTPVTASGQVVGLVLDKSGRGNHAFQTNASSKPILQQDSGGRWYLAFDGTDDFLVTNSIDFTATDKMSVFAGVRKLSDARSGAVATLGISAGSALGSFRAFAPYGATNSYAYATKGTEAERTAAYVNALVAAPVTNIVTGISDIEGSMSAIRVNGSSRAISNLIHGAANFGNYALYIGMQSGTNHPFNGRLYGLIVRGALTPGAQIAQTEAWLAAKTGVTL